MNAAHPIPFAALDGKVGIMGLTGSGKTFTAIGLTEQLLGAGRQVIVVDPTGVYNGLRTVFPVPIFGGKFGDVPIDEDTGEAVARAIVDGDLSAIVDVSLLLKKSHASARRFMRTFVATLKSAPTRARYLVIDEADEFMPENASGDVTVLFGDLKWIVRRGRSEGWRVLMVTQRPQDIAKSVLTQCETMVIHRLTAPQDRKALMEWVKGNADAEQARAVLDSMAKLQTGEAWVWSPAHDLLERVTMPLNRSDDRGKTPDADDGPRATLGFQPVDLAGIRAALQKPDDIQPMSMEISRDDVVSVTFRGQDAKKLRDAQHGVADLRGQLEAMELRANRAERLANLYRARLSDVRVAVGQDEQSVEAQISSIIDVPSRQIPAKPSPATMLNPTIPASSVTGRSPSDASPAALAIADLLDRVNPAKLSWSQACAITGRKASGGNFNSARKWLRESGRIVEEHGLIYSASPAPEGLTRDEAFELWHGVLTNPAPRMMKVLRIYPHSKAELAEALGCASHGGNWNSGISQLKRNGVIVESDGRYTLSDPLPGQGMKS